MVIGIFKFFAKNPPSILIAGGILLWLASMAYVALDPLMAYQAFQAETLGTWCIIGGFVLQVLWLVLVGRSRHARASWV